VGSDSGGKTKGKKKRKQKIGGHHATGGRSKTLEETMATLGLGQKKRRKGSRGESNHRKTGNNKRMEGRDLDNRRIGPLKKKGCRESQKLEGKNKRCKTESALFGAENFATKKECVTPRDAKSRA